jgi:hypothetical protein
VKWDKLNGAIVCRYYRSTISHDNPPLYAYIASNGADWWNACISPSDDDEMMECPLRLEVAGATTLAGAKANVAAALAKYIAALNLATAYRPEVPDGR